MKHRGTAFLVVALAVVFAASLVYAASTPKAPQGLPLGAPSLGGQQQQEQAVQSIPAGSAVTVRTDQQIAIGSAKPGDIFPATLEDDIVQGSKVLVRSGAPAEIRLTKVREGTDELAFQLYTVTVSGKKVRVVSDTAREVARKQAPQQQQQQGLGGALGQAGASALGGALSGKGLTWSGQNAQNAQVPAGTFMEFTLREQAMVK